MTQKDNYHGSTWSVFRQTTGLYRGFGVVRLVCEKEKMNVHQSFLGGMFIISCTCFVFYGL